MRTRLILSVAFALISTRIQAQPANIGYDHLLPAIIGTLQSGAIKLSSRPTPALKPNREYLIDLAHFNQQLKERSLNQEHFPERRATVADVQLNPRRWEEVAKCTSTGVSDRTRCELPPEVAIVRIFLTATSSPSSIKLEVGVYRRTELGMGNAGIGGFVTELTFERRANKWFLVAIGNTYTS